VVLDAVVLDAVVLDTTDTGYRWCWVAVAGLEPATQRL
jgi:hypothetical protein